MRCIHLILLSLLSSVTACNRSIRDGIVYTESASIGIVKNGIAFDRATVMLDGHATVVLPSRAKVLRADNESLILIEMKKSLAYMGHPVRRIRINDVRDEMGCVTCVRDSKVHIASFGEFMSPEGGGRIELTVHVPKGVRVERSDTFEIHFSNSDGKFTAEGSDDIWSLVSDEPDAQAAARYEHSR